MGLFSNPRRDFLFKRTARFIGANGPEIATINLVCDHKQPDKDLVIFLKNGGPENRYHILCKRNLKEIIEYFERYLGEIDDEIISKNDFQGFFKATIFALVRGFLPKFGISVITRVAMNDRNFNEFGEIFFGSESDSGSPKTHLYLVYTADEFTHLDRMSKGDLSESLRSLKAIDESYVTA